MRMEAATVSDFILFYFILYKQMRMQAASCNCKWFDLIQFNAIWRVERQMRMQVVTVSDLIWFDIVTWFDLI